MRRKSCDVGRALDGVADLYSDSLSTHGVSPKSVGWKDKKSHHLRFSKLVQVIDPQTANSGFSANDFGCGYGAMFHYLDGVFQGQLKSYCGYDISDSMLAAAKHLVGDSRAEFIKSATVIHEADYSFVSGTFNVKLKASDEEWMEYVKDCLMKLAAKSTKGLAFNLLSTYVDWKEEHLYYGDPFMFFDFCKRNISPYVSLLHDYPLFEWTMLVRKSDYPG